MTITSNLTGQFSLLVNSFRPQSTFEIISAVSNTLEAAFYFSLRGGSIHDKNLVKWFRNTSITYLSKIQFLFNATNVGLIAFSAQKFLNEMQKSYIFSIVKNRYGNKALDLAPVTTIGAIAGVVFLGWKLVNRFSPKLADSESITNKEIGQTHTVDIAETLSTGQTITKILHITKLVLNVALTCFTKNPFWFVVSLTTSSYSLWKNTQFKWITFTRDFSTHIAIFDNQEYKFPYLQKATPLGHITNLKATYHMLALPFGSTASHKKCAVCLEEDMTQKIAFCANHIGHRSCLVDYVHAQTTNFGKISNILKKTTHNYHNGMYTGSNHNYDIRIDPKNLPSCNECGDVLPQNTLNIEITDTIDGKLNATVTIEHFPFPTTLFKFT